MKLTREIKTAILVISSILLFIWGYNFIKGKDLFTNYKTVYVEYDNVEGVVKSAAVTLNGLVVGSINNITINEKTGKILVEIVLKTDFPISKSSTAAIYEPGFIAGKQIAIYPNLEDKTVIVNGDILQGVVKGGLTESLKEKLVPLQEKFEKVLLNVDKLLIGVNNVLDEKGQTDIKKSLAELSKTMEQFHKVSLGANTILDENKAQIKGVVTNFNKISSDFSKISDSLNKANLGQTAKNLEKTLANVDKIMANLQAGKGTMGKMLNDEALYNNLSKTSKELELLLEDVRLHPTRYVNVSVFGKKNKPYVAPVKDTVAKAKKLAFMGYLDNILFAIVLIIGFGYFYLNVKKIIRNINLGTAVNRTDNSKARWKNMAMIALGQSKMVKRPVAGILHIIVYVGFIIINIELLEIIIDGLFGTHRIFAFLGTSYNVLIASFEILALLVLVAVFAFWTRRNIIKLKRFANKDLTGFPKSDANYILYFEVVLMSLFLLMNATDLHLQNIPGGYSHFIKAGSFPISQFIEPMFNGMSNELVMLLNEAFWWLHIIGILCFMNYLYFSKHLHILLAFPNTYFANLNPEGQFDNLASVTAEVKLMMDPNADPYATPAPDENAVPAKFGASDIQDLNWVQLMNAYTCTECGRCTSSCPANLTGKLLSPRKIMMDTRDRIEEVGKNIDANNGVFVPDNKSLLNDYITPEELWACTSCNACVEECPVNISPLSIIMDMRRYLVMEQSAAPTSLNAMMSNIENNGAPWQYSQQDRLNWKNE